MATGTAKFSGSKEIRVADTDAEVAKLLYHHIPRLFATAEIEHEDYAGTVNEIQAAVWIAARSRADMRLMNSASDTKKELEVIGRQQWIPKLEGRLCSTNVAKVSDEAWWQIIIAKQAEMPGAPTSLTVNEYARHAAKAAKNSVAEKPKESEIQHTAAMLLVGRVVTALSGNDEALGIPLVSYNTRQPPTKIVQLLADLGKVAGIYHALGTWRNDLMEAKRARKRDSGGQART